MKVWITKYALSGGLKVEEAEQCRSNSKLYSVRGYQSSFWDSELAFTHEDAVIKANEMRIRKIASLHKQIAKLEKLTF